MCSNLVSPLDQILTQDQLHQQVSTPPTGSNLSTPSSKEAKNKELQQPVDPSKTYPFSSQPTNTSAKSVSEPSSNTTTELKQRILEILSSSSNEECERELAKLKTELENRNRQMAAALSAAQLSAGTQGISSPCNVNTCEGRTVKQNEDSGQI